MTLRPLFRDDIPPPPVCPECGHDLMFRGLPEEREGETKDGCAWWCRACGRWFERIET